MWGAGNLIWNYTSQRKSDTLGTESVRSVRCQDFPVTMKSHCMRLGDLGCRTSVYVVLMKQSSEAPLLHEPDIVSTTAARDELPRLLGMKSGNMKWNPRWGRHASRCACQHRQAASELPQNTCNADMNLSGAPSTHRRRKSLKHLLAAPPASFSSTAVTRFELVDFFRLTDS